MKFQTNLSGILLLLFVFPVGVFAQSSATYDLSHNVVSGGGGNLANAGANYRLDGTIGQAAAGTVSTSALYGLHGGFWFAQPLAPTAARVSILGRVNNLNGGIVRRVGIILTNSTTGEIRAAQTNTFGFYRFDNVEVGHVYTVQAQSRSFQFTPENYVFSLLEQMENLNFTAIAAQ